LIITVLGGLILPRVTLLVFITYTLDQWGGFTQAGGGSIFIILVVGFLVAALLDGVQISCWLFDGGANKPQNG